MADVSKEVDDTGESPVVWVEQKGFYNLPVSTVEKSGVFKLEDVKRMRLIVSVLMDVLEAARKVQK